jgi:serine/threonine protein kinase
MDFERIQLGDYYQLVRCIGEGGTGTVYLAEDTRSQNRQLAIKVIKTDVSPTNYHREIEELAFLFQREVSTITALKHENILPLYDFGVEAKGRTLLGYMVMPFCQQGTFEDWLAKRKSRLRLQDVMYFIVQAAHTLQYVHDKQIIHRDVKPQNFLIKSNRADTNHPYLLLSDFGLAKFTNKVTSRNRTLRGGTWIYTPPEQWNGNAVYASDQYALAIIAYELLTANPPFVGSPEEIFRQHVMDQPDPPSKHNPEIPRGLDDVIMQALAKKPEDRFDSIAAFATACQQAAEPDVIFIDLANPSGGVANTSDRNQDAAIVGTALLIAGAGLALGAVGLASYLLKKMKENKIAEKNATPDALLPAPRPVALPQELFTNALDYLGNIYVQDCVEKAQISIDTDRHWNSKLKICFELAAVEYVHNVHSTAQEVAVQLKPGVKTPAFRPGELVASRKEGMYGATIDRPFNVAPWVAKLLAQPLGDNNSPLGAELDAWISKVAHVRDSRRETLELIHQTAERMLPSLKAEAVMYLQEVDKCLSTS